MRPVDETGGACRRVGVLGVVRAGKRRINAEQDGEGQSEANLAGEHGCARVYPDNEEQNMVGASRRDVYSSPF